MVLRGALLHWGHGIRLVALSGHHHDVALTTSLMVLCPLSVALCGVELRPLNLGSESLRVCIDVVGGRQLLVVVLEGELVLTLFWHLHPNSCLDCPMKLGFLALQQVFSSVAMKTALAKVLALPVLVLIVEEAVEVLDPGVENFAGHFNQQQVDPWYLLWLLAEAVDSDALVQAKYTDGQVTLLLHFGDLRDGNWGIDPLKVQTIFGVVPSWSLWVIWWRWICQSRSERPSKTVVIPFFMLITAFLHLTSAGSEM